MQAIKATSDLIPVYAGLMAIRESVVEQYKNIAERSKYNDTQMFEVHFVITKLSTQAYRLLAYLESDLEDFFKCSKVLIVKDGEEPEMKYAALSAFKYKGTIDGVKVELPVSIFRRMEHKCVRCHKYVNEEEGQVCGGCQEYIEEGSGKLSLVEDKASV